MPPKAKTVLVTGACGFIGSHLVEHLLDEGFNVKALVLYNPLNSWGRLDDLPKEKLKSVEVFLGDVRDLDSLKPAFKKVDMALHLAALIGIPYSYHSPTAYLNTNIKGTLNILQLSREFNLERTVITSSSEVYGSALYVPMDEKHPLQAQSPYAASKIAADKLAESFYLSFQTPMTIIRPFNTYGPRQSARAVIPTIISQILSDVPHINLGNKHPTRDLNYVEDICRGFIEIIKQESTIGKTINICSGNEISIGHLAQLILDLMNSDKKVVYDSTRKRPDKSEVERLLGSNTLLTSLSQWKQKHSLKEGLQKTIEWFSNKENLSHYKPNVYHI